MRETTLGAEEMVWEGPKNAQKWSGWETVKKRSPKRLRTGLGETSPGTQKGTEKAPRPHKTPGSPNNTEVAPKTPQEAL